MIVSLVKKYVRNGNEGTNIVAYIDSQNRTMNSYLVDLLLSINLHLIDAGTKPLLPIPLWHMIVTFKATKFKHNSF